MLDVSVQKLKFCTRLFEVLIPGGAKYIYFSSKRPDRLWGPPGLLLNWHWDIFPEVKRPEVEVDHSI